jgi:hypothetical protein
MCKHTLNAPHFENGNDVDSDQKDKNTREAVKRTH